MTTLTSPVQFKHPLFNDHAAAQRTQQAHITFYTVLHAAQRIQSHSNRGLALYVIQCAVDNADDTCILEKARHLTEWDAMFRGSVETVLACTVWAGKFQGTVGQLRTTRNHLETFFRKFGLVG